MTSNLGCGPRFLGNVGPGGLLPIIGATEVLRRNLTGTAYQGAYNPISVDLFGVKPSNTAAANNAALTTALASGYRHFWMGRGTFNFSTGFVLPDHCMLEGDEQAATVLNFQGAVPECIVANQTFTMKRLTLQGSGAAQVGLLVGKTTDVCVQPYLEGVRIAGFTLDGLRIRHSIEGLAHSCRFEGNGRGTVFGNAVTVVGNPTTWAFLGCVWQSNTGHGFEIEQGWGITFAGRCVFEANGLRGLQCIPLSALATVSGVDVGDSWFEGNDVGHPLALSGAFDARSCNGIEHVKTRGAFGSFSFVKVNYIDLAHKTQNGGSGLLLSDHTDGVVRETYQGPIDAATLSNVDAVRFEHLVSFAAVQATGLAYAHNGAAWVNLPDAGAYASDSTLDWLYIAGSAGSGPTIKYLGESARNVPKRVRVTLNISGTRTDTFAVWAGAKSQLLVNGAVVVGSIGSVTLAVVDPGNDHVDFTCGTISWILTLNPNDILSPQVRFDVAATAFTADLNLQMTAELL